MPGWVERAKSLRSHVPYLGEVFIKMAFKVRAKDKTSDMKMVSKQAYTERAEHLARIA